MSEIGQPELVEENYRNKIKELIPIQCIQYDCDQQGGLLTSVPASTLDFDSDQRSRFIIFVCQRHLKLRQWTSKGQALYTILAKESNVDLKPIQDKTQDKSVQFHKANQFLDKKSCCMRESLKMVNLQTIFTFLSLISNDEDKLKKLVLNLMIQQYFQYQQVRNEYEMALQNGNIISILRLTHRYQTMKKKIYKQYENILETTQFLSDNSFIARKGLSISAISFVKVMIPLEEI